MQDWSAGLSRLRDLGAPIPADVTIGTDFTHADANGRNTRQVGGCWLEHQAPDAAMLITWRLPGADVSDHALAEKNAIWPP